MTARNWIIASAVRNRVFCVFRFGNGRAGNRGIGQRARSVRRAIIDFRIGYIRWLLRCLERDASATHASDVGHQCGKLGDRRRRIAGGRYRRRLAF